jgi:hypothetical protein
VRTRVLGAALVGLAVVGVTIGCDEPRKEKPWERVTRLRLHYKVEPNFYEMQKDKDGKPVLFMDLGVTNTGKESLDKVTMVLHVVYADGKDRVRMPLTLDTSHLLPGVPGKIVVTVPGVEVREGEEVTLQMEGQPTRADMGKYPEYTTRVN